MYDPQIAVLVNASALLTGLLKVDHVIPFIFARLEAAHFIWMIGIQVSYRDLGAKTQRRDTRSELICGKEIRLIHGFLNAG